MIIQWAALMSMYSTVYINTEISTCRVWKITKQGLVSIISWKTAAPVCLNMREFIYPHADNSYINTVILLSKLSIIVVFK